MRAQLALFLGLAAAGLASSQARKLDLSHPSKDLIVPFHPERVHFVDRVGQNALFRGNEPIVNGSAELSYETVVNEIKKKVSRGHQALNFAQPINQPTNPNLTELRHSLQALDEANWVIPEPFYIDELKAQVDERKDINAEESFFNANPNLGTYLEWPLFGVPFPPSLVGSSLQKYLAGGPIWLAGASYSPPSDFSGHSRSLSAPSLRRKRQ